MGSQQYDLCAGIQFGYLNPDRITLTLINSFADGSTSQDGAPVDTRVNLYGLLNTYGIYATDTISLTNRLRSPFPAATTTPRLTMRIGCHPIPGARGSLNGQYEFDRFNPAAGVVYSPFHCASSYFGYSGGTERQPRLNWVVPILPNRAICPMRLFPIRP